ncbi:unnamed protein product [Camellia sinensis]|uniref:cytochrome b561 domain-containing protein At4g18260-like isoform X1 n=1 Tax=Camellia sinensis TaxID=4442 RepID=UPI001035FC28|nr:cytochrome b561 domain-containing protein At4g18260-like isoform X1 [Camellia sinensis]
MQIMKKLVVYSTTTTTTHANFILLFLPFVGCSSHDHLNKATNHKEVVSHQKTFDITVHGVLLWASMGLLMPLGILTIRLSHREECRRWFRGLFYFHAILQTLSLLLATAGAILSIRSFENAFNNNHQRIGLALYGAIWLQALIAFRRPRRGSKGRSVWYFVHWALGTTISLLGIFNIYTGLQAYHKRTSRSIRVWTILFTTQIFFIVFFYLFQDKWEYIQRQGVILGNETIITPSNDQVIPQRDNRMSNELCRKTNSLGNYFAKSNALKKLFQLT